MRAIRVCLILVMVVTLGGCLYVPVAGKPGRGQGPPAHAPAHGHREHASSGPEMRFDSQLGVYVVVGYEDLFFTDGRYLRLTSGGWQVSVDLDGPWRDERDDALPPGLRKNKGNGRGKALGHSKGKGKPGNSPAKGRW